MIKRALYNTIALGGTFDHLHDGHKDFLLFASQLGRFLIIGVTDQHMTLQKPYAELIQPTHVRKQAVLNFCSNHNIQAKLITLLDPFGPTIEENSIEAVVCTTETLKGANKINEIRNKLHLKELPIHVHQLKKDSLGTGIISAERVRAGEIDRSGTVYAGIFQDSVELSQKAREFFTKPHGKLFTAPAGTQNKNTLRVIVGDTTLETFINNNWHYNLGIFDRKRQRKEVVSEVLDSLENVIETKNEPGKITKAAVSTVQNWLEDKNFKHVFVAGEEDLIAVAAVLLLPLGSYVYYGQPSVGMIECLVTEDIKEAFYAALTNS